MSLELRLVSGSSVDEARGALPRLGLAHQVVRTGANEGEQRGRLCHVKTTLRRVNTVWRGG